MVYKGGSLKQPSVPHRFDPHLLGPLLLVSTPAVPLADRKSFPLAPLLNNKPLTSRQSTLKTATYIRVYARHNSVLAARNPFIVRSICTIYREKKFCAKRREREREREGERGGSRHAERVQGVAQLCVRLCFSLRNPRLTERTAAKLTVSVVALTRSEESISLVA